jgi:hypothetical protein
MKIFRVLFVGVTVLFIAGLVCFWVVQNVSDEAAVSSSLKFAQIVGFIWPRLCAAMLVLVVTGRLKK